MTEAPRSRAARRGPIVFMAVWLTLWSAAILVVLWMLGGAALSGDLGAAPFLLLWLGFAGLGLYAGLRRMRALLGLAGPPRPAAPGPVPARPLGRRHPAAGGGRARFACAPHVCAPHLCPRHACPRHVCPRFACAHLVWGCLAFARLLCLPIICARPHAPVPGPFRPGPLGRRHRPPDGAGLRQAGVPHACARASLAAPGLFRSRVWG